MLLSVADGQIIELIIQFHIQEEYRKLVEDHFQR